MDCECEGCATKIRRFVRGIQGVETVKGGGELSKLTVAGKIDPVKLQEMVEQKIGKKVQLVSPVPKKDNKDGGGGGGGGGGGEKKAEGKPDKKPDEKKSKEPPVTTAVMKVTLHCQGCIHKIRKVVTKTKGYQDMSIDEQKDQVTVKGTMDMKALAEALNERLKRPVEIVQPKKDNAEKKEKGGGGGGAKKEKGGGGGEEGKTGGDDGGGQVVEENRIQYVPQEYPNTYMYGFGMQGYPVEQYHHAPQMFSDENPNACSVM
ncbi:hypothetical protein RHSIM_Rhsim13G0099100 [Rhododendron simsii]|uniref:HMA domain-containing protein n=1 Tax=Rhododendron simsii TaxID=118357 RepID=A0A834G6Q9_RHOSS|nr:hypothetical protein RHSIM_Rhsim13G0099100 [Rhododendron simsii]